jgi:hypothetical protein
VTFSNGGNGKSKPLNWKNGKIVVYKDTGYYPSAAHPDGTRYSKDCMKHVKVLGKTYLHYTPSLSNSYGKALKKDQKVKYRRVWSLDDRLVPFYGVRYNGKCLWVSSLYTKLVK